MQDHPNVLINPIKNMALDIKNTDNNNNNNNVAPMGLLHATDSLINTVFASSGINPEPQILNIQPLTYNIQLLTSNF